VSGEPEREDVLELEAYSRSLEQLAPQLIKFCVFKQMESLKHLESLETLAGDELTDTSRLDRGYAFFDISDKFSMSSLMWIKYEQRASPCSSSSAEDQQDLLQRNLQSYNPCEEVLLFFYKPPAPGEATPTTWIRLIPYTASMSPSTSCSSSPSPQLAAAASKPLPSTPPTPADADKGQSPSMASPPAKTSTKPKSSKSVQELLVDPSFLRMQKQAEQLTLKASSPSKLSPLKNINFVGEGKTLSSKKLPPLKPMKLQNQKTKI
jgi:hypothetical protein